MATYGHTFTSGDTLTPTKLNAARTATNIVNADISASAAIALSKLATGALPTAITIASANLVNDTIVNADINPSAAIAATKLASNSITNTQIKFNAAIEGTKIDPNFGAQGVETTGNVTATRLVAGTGSAAQASVTFTGDGDTGIFRPEENTLAFCKGGAEAMRINSSGLVGVNTTDPQYRLDVNGVINSASHYRLGGFQVVGARATGWETPTGLVDRTTYTVSTVTVAQLAARLNALIRDLEAHGLIGPTPP